MSRTTVRSRRLQTARDGRRRRGRVWRHVPRGAVPGGGRRRGRSGGVAHLQVRSAPPGARLRSAGEKTSDFAVKFILHVRNVLISPPYVRLLNNIWKHLFVSVVDVNDVVCKERSCELLHALSPASLKPVADRDCDEHSRRRIVFAEG